MYMHMHRQSDHRISSHPRGHNPKRLISSYIVRQGTQHSTVRSDREKASAHPTNVRKHHHAACAKHNSLHNTRPPFHPKPHSLTHHPPSRPIPSHPVPSHLSISPANTSPRCLHEQPQAHALIRTRSPRSHTGSKTARPTPISRIRRRSSMRNFSLQTAVCSAAGRGARGGSWLGCIREVRGARGWEGGVAYRWL